MGCSGSQISDPKMVAEVPPQPPYLGPPCEYRMENFLVPYVVQSDFGFMPVQGMSLTTLDVNVYNMALGSLYDLGYRLVSFSVVPSSYTADSHVKGDVKQTHKYQGICRKLPEDEQPQQWSLKVVKSFLPSKVFTYGLFRLGSESQTIADSNHIFQTISQEAANGARLVCIEITGFNSQNVKASTTAKATAGFSGSTGSTNMCFFGQSPETILGVDIFLEIPRNPTSARYVYQCVTIPMKITWTTAMDRKWNTEMDWVGVTSQYLGSGWRMVEVFMDQNNSAFHDSDLFTTNMTINQNCIFFFEKEQSKMNDNTPIYEATMVQYHSLVKMKSKIDTTITTITTFDTAWEPVVTQLGTFGWELVKILDTPVMNFESVIGRGFITFKKVMWMFFQRKIVTVSVPLAGVNPPPVAATP
ncbi:uncharacterized protein LOC125652799 [Ostrea edulis]|uniref:uncharacterized protein LOC125652799 n=1 Tax=Ostrea edulis TaxID=37623 RepID=UPI0024AEAA81|nr:uncharacterized protein LOC125652799 [Ostrea edulis]